MNKLLRAICLLAACLLLLPFPGAPGQAEGPTYVENEWNYVDGSMDVSGGIPEGATGRLARIREAGKLTVATEPYFPPQEFIDESKSGQEQYVGSDMELARLIARRMGVELEIVPMEFNDVLESVAEGKYDLAISALAFTSQRAGTLEMSKGYYFTSEKVSSGLLIRVENMEDIQGIGDLASRDIVAQSGSLQESMAIDNIVFYRMFRRLSSIEDVYAAVTDGSADAGIVDVESAQMYIQAHKGCGLAVVPGIYFPLQPEYEGDRVAAQKGELELMYFVNGVIDEVLSGQYDAWFEEYSRYGE